MLTKSAKELNTSLMQPEVTLTISSDSRNGVNISSNPNASGNIVKVTFENAVRGGA